MAIIALVVIGVMMVAAGFRSPEGVQASLANLWNGGDLFPNGFHGFVGAFQIAVFAFVDTKLIGTAALSLKSGVQREEMRRNCLHFLVRFPRGISKSIATPKKQS